MSLVLTNDRVGVSANYAQYGYDIGSCANSDGEGDRSGGFYNHGTIDATPGALGTVESPGGRSAPSVEVDASDEVAIRATSSRGAWAGAREGGSRSAAPRAACTRAAQSTSRGR